MNGSDSIAPQRKPLRFEGYDYSPAGMYFVTICTQNRRCRFGRVVEGVVQLNDCGRIVDEEWHRTSRLRSNVMPDAFVIMPNHLHAIVVIDYPTFGYRQPDEPCQRLDRVVAGFKAACTRRIHQIYGQSGVVLWQRSFYDQIIRSERHLQHLRTYIENNPGRWAFDHDFRSDVPDER